MRRLSFARRRRPPWATKRGRDNLAVSVANVTVGYISPEQSKDMSIAASVIGLRDLLPKIQEATGLSVEPGSFYVGMVYAASSGGFGMTTEAIHQMVNEQDLAAIVERVRAEV